MFFPSVAPAARRLFRLLPAAALLAVSPLTVSAQAGGGIDHTGTGGKHTIQGRIFAPTGARSEVRAKVRLESSGSGELTVLSDSNGSFSFRSIKPGTYTLVVDAGEQFEVARETVVIDGANDSIFGGGSPGPPRVFTVPVYLQPKGRTVRSEKAGVIHAGIAGVPKPAVELYQQALASARKGDNKKAVEHLKAALAVHPDFALALGELGVLHMKLKEPAKAAEALSAALKLAPGDYAALITYGRALFDLQKYPESEAQFRKALDRNAASPSAHFYVGMILLKRQDLDGAEKSLTAAVKHGGGEMAVAHYYLGGIYWGRKDYRRAADELETYLRLAPDAENAARVRATIKELRSKI